MTDEEINRAAALMSAERLAAFVQIAGTERDAIAIHQQTILVASALMPVACIFEIALRNAICERLRGVFGTPDWLMAPPAPFRWKASEQGKLKDARRQAQQAAYTKMTDSEKKTLDAAAFPGGIPAGTLRKTRAKKRQAQIPVMHGQLISQLTLFFWKRLFSSDYEETLWKRGLKDLFPNKKVARPAVSDHLERLYLARNRIAHHEPIYGDRLRKLCESIEFMATHFEARRPSQDAILATLTAQHRQRLAQVTSETDELIGKFTVQPSASACSL